LAAFFVALVGHVVDADALATAVPPPAPLAAGCELALEPQPTTKARSAIDNAIAIVRNINEPPENP
jgi:hypothetical protein